MPRKTALETLIARRPPDLRAICEQVLRVRFLNSTAIKGLALFDDPGIAVALLTNYHSFHAFERPVVIDTLCSRPSFARVLLDGMAERQVPRADHRASRWL